MLTAGRVGLAGGRTLKELPVEVSWRVGGRFRSLAIVALPLHLGVIDGTESASLDPWLALLEMLPTALLQADLNDTPRCPDSLDGSRSGVNVIGEGLLAVDVLAGLGALDNHRGVPVVRRRDENGVNIFALQDTAVVDNGIGRRWQRGRCLVAMGFEDVANRNDLAVRVRGEHRS
jgi:hypothetical protein